MIEPAKDRLDYGEMLAPPEDGFELEIAVATTYSLDLSALLASMLPLGFGGDACDNCRDNPVFMLHALKRLLPKLYVFCDAAEIKYPQSREHRLLNMLDQVVFPVRVPNAFHPKFWLLKYVKGKEARYRLIVLSKNISFDRSWDVAMSFDGTLQESPGNGAPLAAMLVYLKGTQRGKTDRLSRISPLAKEIEFVSFCNNDIKPESFELLPFGIGNKIAWPFPERIERLLVMSPFLSRDAVTKLFHSVCGKKILIARKDAMSGFSDEMLVGIDCFCIRDEIYNGETSDNLNSAPDQPQNQDIHAKIYLLQRKSNERSDLYIGSANLTDNGLPNPNERNVELLVHVRFKRNDLFDSICKDLLNDGKDDSAFVKCLPPPSTEKSEHEKIMDTLKKAFKDLLWIRYSATVEVSEESKCLISLKPNKLKSFECDLEFVPIGGGIPIMVEKGNQIPEEMHFELSLETVSNFYSVRMSRDGVEMRRVLFIDTLSKECLEKRDAALEKTCTKKTEDFMEYLNYMLAKDAYSEAVLHGSSKQTMGARTANTALSGIYEKMLSFAAEEPSRLKEIWDIIQRHTDTNEEISRLAALCEKFCVIARGTK